MERDVLDFGEVAGGFVVGCDGGDVDVERVCTGAVEDVA